MRHAYRLFPNPSCLVEARGADEAGVAGELGHRLDLVTLAEDNQDIVGLELQVGRPLDEGAFLTRDDNRQDGRPGA